MTNFDFLLSTPAFESFADVAVVARRSRRTQAHFRKA